MDTNIFDKIQDAIMVAGKELKDTAEDFSAQAKLRYEIRTRENYLNELYTELGKKYYSEHKDDPIEEGKTDSFEEIRTLLDELSELHKELADKRGADRCPRCGALVSQESDYCGKCGAYMHEED